MNSLPSLFLLKLQMPSMAVWKKLIKLRRLGGGWARPRRAHGEIDLRCHTALLGVRTW